MDLIQFRVHPGVGMARIGQSTDWYFLGPEIPRFLQEQYPFLRHRPTPRPHPEKDAASAEPRAGRYRDADQQLMPQAARFRVFAYFYTPGDDDPYRVVEITSADADIEWQVELANVKSVKAGGTPQVDPNAPGVFTLSTKAASPPTKCQQNSSLPNLAYLMLEKDSNGSPNGRLHVIGNEGDADGPAFSRFPPPRLFLDGWHDPAADGSVMATVELKPAFTSRFPDFKYLAYGQKDPVALPADRKVLALPAWVVVNLPDYVPDMGHFVSLWDLALGQAWKFVMDRRATPVDGQHHLAVKPGEVHSYAFFDYFTHIHPLLGLFSDVPYVSGQARAGAIQDRNFMKGVRVAGKLQSSATDTDTTIEVLIADAFRLKVASLDQPFLILLTADPTKPLTAAHEFVLCTSVGDDGKLTVARAQQFSDARSWPIDTGYFAATRGGWLQTTLIGQVSAAQTTIQVDVQSGYKMPLPTAAGAPARDGPFKIGVAVGSTVEWMTCTANNRVDGEFARELTVTRGVDGTVARDWADGSDVFAPASGHKQLDARARASELSQLPGASIQKTLFGRLRKPSTVYDRTDFTKIRGGVTSVYPREFGRRMVFDQVSTDPDDFDDTVNIDPAGSVARYHDVFTKRRKFACHGRVVGPDGKSFVPDDGRSVPPKLDDEDTPKPDVWGSDPLDHAVRLDDYYWIVSPADMPLLKEYALTHIQYAQFEVWANTRVAKGFNPRWAPLFEVVFKGSELEKFFQADGHSAEDYLDKLLTLRPLYGPAFLDMASMSKMLGGSFLPGIEVGREAGKPGNWSLYRGGTKYFPDVRFHPQGRSVSAAHRPGTLTKDLAVPWFVDFISCDETFWPTSAPQTVYQEQGIAYTWLGSKQVPDEAAMRSYWKRLGFIRRQPDGTLIEQESLFDRP